MNMYRSIKMIIGFALALTISLVLNLEFPISAGMIAMLNMLDTKRATADIAWKRIKAAVLGILIATIVFSLLGYNYYVLVLLIGIFIPLAYKFNVKVGIAVYTVIISHFLVYQDVSLNHIFNEFGLVLVGGLVSLMVNVHMPNHHKTIEILQKNLEDQIKQYILKLSYQIKSMCLIDDLNFKSIENILDEGLQLAYDYRNNFFIKEEKYYIEYFLMRKDQLQRLKYMDQSLTSSIMNYDEAVTLSQFTERLSLEFDHLNDGRSLLASVHDIQKLSETLPLPESHFELEQRTFYYRYLRDLEEFILIKIRFNKLFQS